MINTQKTHEFDQLKAATIAWFTTITPEQRLKLLEVAEMVRSEGSHPYLMTLTRLAEFAMAELLMAEVCVKESEVKWDC